MAGFDEFLNSGSTPSATTLPDTATPPQTNSFDSFLSGEDQQNQVKQSLSIVDAMGITPDHAAEAKALAKKTGVPAIAVESNLPEVKKQAQRLDLVQAAKTNPDIARLLSDPNVAKITMDDVGPLTRVADTVRALPGGALQGIGQGLSGLGRLNDVAGRTIARTMDATLRGVGLDKLADATASVLNTNIPWWLNPGQIVKRPGDVVQKVGEEVLPPPERQNMSTDISSGVGQVASQIAASLVNPASAVALMSGQGAETLGARVDQAHIAGTPEGDAAITMGATVTALTEKVGLDWLMNRVPPEIKNKIVGQLVDIGLAGGGQALQQVTQTVMNNVVTQQFVNPNQKTFEGMDRDAISAGGSGMIARAVLNAVTHANVRGQAIDQQRQTADQAVTQADALNRVVDVANESKTLQRDPDTFKQFLSQVSQDTGIENVHIPAEKLVEYYQSKGVDPFSVEALDKQDLATALATGGDVAIPLSDYVTDFGKDHNEGLGKYVKMSDDGMTMEESESFHASLDDIVAQENESIRGEMEKGQAKEAPGDRVFSDVYDQLVGAGQSPDVANRNALTQKHFFESMSDRMGGDAWTHYEPDRLTIQRQFNRPDLNQSIDGMDMFIADAKDHYKKQAAAQARAEKQGGQADMLGGVKSKRTKATPRPLVSYLMGLGGINPKGKVSAELAAMDINPKNTPRLFKADGRGDLDNIPASEFNEQFADSGVNAQEDGNGYVDRDYLLGLMRDETFGNYLRTPEQRESEERIAHFDDLRSYVGNLGHDLETSSPAAIKEAIAKDQARQLSDDDLYQNGKMKTESPAFKEWFGDSKVVDADGKPLVVYHGSTADFESFDSARANPESDLGGGFYFTNATGDVGTNYAGEGPDLTQKIQREAERIADETDRHYSDDDVIAEAKESVGVEHQGATYPVYLAIKNPVEIGGENETQFTYNQEYDDETDEFGDEKGTLVDLIDAVHEVAGNGEFSSIDAQSVIDSMMSNFDDGQISASYLVSNMKGSETIIYADGDNGNLVGNEFIRQVFKEAGYDGIIDHTVNQKFGSEKQIGKPMEGMDENTVHYVAFNPEQIKSVFNNGEFNANDPRILFQDKDGIRGSYSPTTNVVKLFEAANLSTFLHESGHYWLEMMGKFNERARSDIANHDAAVAEKSPIGLLDDSQLVGRRSVIDDYATILNHIGADHEKPLTTEQHEAFARTVEAYFMTGKAPSVELQGAFQRFKSWLTSIYKDTMALGVKINPEITGVMNRMFATEHQIHDAERMSKFELLDLDGATTTEKAALQRLHDAATAEAERKLLVKAIEPIRRQREKWYKEEWNKTADDVQSEFEQQPKWRALEMTRGSEGVDPVRLDIGMLEDQFGSGIKSLLPRGVTVKRGGVDPEIIAEHLGLPNARALVEELGSIKDLTLKKAVKAETDTRMNAKHGDILHDGSMEAEALNAVHNEKRGDAIAMELKVLRRLEADKVARRSAERRITEEGAHDPQTYRSEAAVAETGMERLIAEETGKVARFARAYDRSGKAQLSDAMADIKPQAIREAARRVIGKMKAKDLGRTAQFARAEVKASELSRKSIANRDYERAAFYKYRQLLNHYLFIEANAAHTESESIVKYLGRLAGKKTVASLDQEYLDQIHGLLEMYDFKKASQKEVERRKSFAAWTAEQEAAGREVVASDKLINMSQTEHYSGVPLDDLRTLKDTVKQIEYFGRMKQKLLDLKEEREFNDLVSEAVDQVESTGDVVAQSVNRNPKGMDKVKSMLRGADAALLKIEQIVDWLDGGNPNGVFNRVVFRRIADAQTKEGDMTVKYVKGLDEAMSGLDSKRLNEIIEVPSVRNRNGDVVRWQRSELMAVALNMGNEDNLHRLMNQRGENWSEQQIKDLTDNLNPSEWKAVQKTWDLIETLWPEIEAMEKSLNGVAPPKVESRSFDVVSDGETINMKGGYYPLVYDPSQDFTVAQREERRMSGLFSENGYVRATTEKGHTKERSEGYARPLLLDMNVIPRHISQVIHDLSYREAIMDVDRFMADGRVKGAVARALGPEIAGEFRPWLQSIAADRNMDSGQPTSKALRYWNRAVAQFRTNATIVGMGLRYTTVIAQVAGYSASVEMIGPKWAGVGLKEFYGSGNPKEIARITREVMDKSGEMRNRHNNMDRDIRDGVRRLTKGSIMSDVQNFAFSGIAIMDRGVSVPTWLGAYQKGLSEGMSEGDAIAYGDKVVRMSQGAGGIKDHAAVQRGNESFKMLTMFYSYFSAMYSRQRDIGRAVKDGNYGTALARSWWLMVLPSILGEVLAGRGPNDDDDKLAWAARKAAVYPFMGIPLLRDVTGALESGYGYKMSPLTRVGETMVKFGGNVGKLATGGDVDGKNMTKQGLDVLGYGLGLPTGQVGTTGKYLWDYLDGTESPDGIIDFARGVTIGPKKK
jgi:hypothetical protein